MANTRIRLVDLLFIVVGLSPLASTHAAELTVTRDLPYVADGHERQVLDVHAPSGAKNLPVVFWIHGGGWQAGDKTAVQVKPQAFVDRGFVFVAMNYRLLPHVEMGEIIRDIAKSAHWVHDHIAEYGGDPERMLVMGHSAGAQLAALICTDDRYLHAEGLSLNMVKGCVPVDGQEQRCQEPFLVKPPRKWRTKVPDAFILPPFILPPRQRPSSAGSSPREPRSA